MYTATYERHGITTCQDHHTSVTTTRKNRTLGSIQIIRAVRFPLTCISMSHRTLGFICGARSAFKLKEKELLEKHAIAPSAASHCWARRGLMLHAKRLVLTANNIIFYDERYRWNSAQPFAALIHLSEDNEPSHIALSERIVGSRCFSFHDLNG
jgi:hypothetical protein